ncbi:MAG: hypothetical protein PGMFKBFP_02405 [Anaerolineales bacterium]|nr:hypothetical protein [Anaerolineales bacterium]
MPTTVYEHSSVLFDRTRLAMFEQSITGFSSSSTSTSNEHTAELPLSSTTVYVTVDVPLLNTVPEASPLPLFTVAPVISYVIVTGQLS